MGFRQRGTGSHYAPVLHGHPLQDHAATAYPHMISDLDRPRRIDRLPALVPNVVQVGIHHENIPAEQTVAAENDFFATDDLGLGRYGKIVAKFKDRMPANIDLAASADKRPASQHKNTPYIPDRRRSILVSQPVRTDFQHAGFHGGIHLYPPFQRIKTGMPIYESGESHGRSEREIIKIENQGLQPVDPEYESESVLHAHNIVFCLAVHSNFGDYIQIYTNGFPKPYILQIPAEAPALTDLRHAAKPTTVRRFYCSPAIRTRFDCPRLATQLEAGLICRRGFAASGTTGGHVNTFADLIRYKLWQLYTTLPVSVFCP